jgi:hypothetical protein
MHSQAPEFSLSMTTDRGLDLPCLLIYLYYLIALCPYQYLSLHREER